MGRFDGFLICTDFDGTYSYDSSHVSKENAEAVEYFKSEGGLFTVASGRNPNFLSCYKDILGANAPVMCLNGGILASPDTFKPLETFHLPLGIQIPLSDFILSHEGVDSLEIFYGDCECIWWNRKDGVSPLQIFSAAPPPYYNIVLIQSRAYTVDYMHELRRLHSDILRFDSSWPEGIEVQGTDGGKGNALKRIKRLCPRPVTKIIAVGDYENDISMLTKADLGIAVGNALDSVKKAADIVTVKNTDHAIARIINHIL